MTYHDQAQLLFVSKASSYFLLYFLNSASDEIQALKMTLFGFATHQGFRKIQYELEVAR